MMLDSFFESVFDSCQAELSAPIRLSRNTQPFRFQLDEAAYPLSVPMTPGNQSCIGEIPISSRESDHVRPLEIPSYWRPFFEQSRQKLLDLLENDPDDLEFTGVDMGSPQKDGVEASPELVCKRKEIYLSILRKYFQQPFCDEISQRLFSDDPWSAKVSNGIDLRKQLPVSLQGYTQGYFTDIPSLLPEKKVGFSTDVRAASHEDNEMYRRDIMGFIDRLAEGGVLDHDAGRESYIRDDRSDILLEILTEKNCSSPSGNEYRGYAFVDKGASPRTKAQAIWIERAQENGKFRSLETIGQCIDVEKYDIIPLKEYANRFFIRYESRIRRIFKTVFYEKYGNWDRVKQQFVNEKVKKTIEDWIQFIETHMPDLLEMEEIFSIIGSEVRMSAFECATSVPETKSIQVKVPPIYKVDEIPPSRISLSLVMRP